MHPYDEMAESALEIIRFHPSILAKTPARQDIVGVEDWVDLQLRSVRGRMDFAREIMIVTRDGEVYPVYYEGMAFLHPTLAALESGLWRIGDVMVTVSGVPTAALHEGDLLVQYPNAAIQEHKRIRKHQ